MGIIIMLGHQEEGEDNLVIPLPWVHQLRFSESLVGVTLLLACACQCFDMSLQCLSLLKLLSRFLFCAYTGFHMCERDDPLRSSFWLQANADHSSWRSIGPHHRSGLGIGSPTIRAWSAFWLLLLPRGPRCWGGCGGGGRARLLQRVAELGRFGVSPSAWIYIGARFGHGVIGQRVREERGEC